MPRVAPTRPPSWAQKLIAMLPATGPAAREDPDVGKVFLIRVRALKGPSPVQNRLRWFLKDLLRKLKFRAVGVPVHEPEPAAKT